MTHVHEGDPAGWAPTTPGATKPMAGIDVSVRELLTAYEAGELTLPQPTMPRCPPTP